MYERGIESVLVAALAVATAAGVILLVLNFVVPLGGALAAGVEVLP